MIVNKFGGASIKDAVTIKKTAAICKSQVKNGIIVVSAMGKTTNLLERLTLNYFKNLSFSDELKQFQSFHLTIIKELFPYNHDIYNNFKSIVSNLTNILEEKPEPDYDFVYDKIVPFGELVSSLIISSYLNLLSYKVELVDARKLIKTNSNFRNGKVLWDETTSIVIDKLKCSDDILYITQGFIGSTNNKENTTLGREGSDYSAAVFAYVLNADKVVVWKDVPGIMCADPVWMPDAKKIGKLSHNDAIELAFYGAKVIHPKTIKPLQNKNIPLEVRSFVNTNEKGTIIDNFADVKIPPVYIKKEDQVLISIKPTDYSFILEENLGHIFNILAEYKITVNLMQNSAVSFSIVVDNDLFRIKKAIAILKKQFYAKYNDNLELITIRHHVPGAESEVLNGKQILLEQHTRTVVRYLIRN